MEPLLWGRPSVTQCRLKTMSLWAGANWREEMPVAKRLSYLKKNLLVANTQLVGLELALVGSWRDKIFRAQETSCI
jgi:hypothetical protein